MIDFPNSPSAGQIFQAAGLTFLWDGVKWKAIAPLPSNNVGRNILHNGLFNIQQRGAPGWSPAVGTVAYTADRWFIFSNAAGDTITGQLYVHTDASRAAIGDEAAEWTLACNVTGGTGANNLCMFGTRIEDVKRLSGKTVTVSWWGTATPNMNVAIGLAQAFGTGGSPSATVYLSSQNVPMTASWGPRYSVTLNIPSVAGKTFGTNAGTDFTQLAFTLSCPAGAASYPIVGAQSGAFAFWGIQLEVGNAPSALEKVNPQLSLADCQRFFQVCQVYGGSYQAAGANVFVATALPVTMRAAPTMTVTNNNNSNLGTMSIGANQNIATIVAPASASGTWLVNCIANLSADL